MKNFLLAMTLLLTVFVLVSSAQQASDFREKYGPPDDKGRYRVRPNIGMKIDVSEAGRPSKMVIKRLDAEEPISTKTLMLNSLATEILAEVIPPPKRGKLRRTSRFAFGCVESETSEYEDVTITIDKRCEAQGGGAYDAVVHWK